MGIKSLTTILNAKCKSAINIRNLQSYRGRILGIDISIYLYKFLYSTDDHLEGITRLLLRLLKNQILPLIVFDGKPPKEKNDVLVSRKEKREYLVTKKEVIEKFIINKDEKSVEELKMEIEEFQREKRENTKLENEDIEELLQKNHDEVRDELEKTVKRIIYVRAHHIESTKQLCDLMGLPYIVCKGEADCLLGHLSREGIIDGCISEDTDVLANGGRIFIRNVIPDKNVVEEFCLEGVLAGLEMTYEQFMDMCILCGCDYTTKIGGMGPQTAYKLIKKHGNIEGVLEELRLRPDKFVIPEGEGFNYEKARDLFLNATQDDNREEIQQRIKIRTPQIDELLVFLSTTKLNGKYVQEIQRNYMNYMISLKQIIPDYARELVIPQTEAQIQKKEVKNNKKITEFFGKM
jgi:flap endonuclease-1